MKRAPIGLFMALALASGCDGSGVQVAVDLRTDLRPGLEFERARTVLTGIDPAGPPRQELASVGADDDALVGTRVAEVDDLSNGAWRVDVELLDARGAVVASGRVLAEVTGARVVTVLVTRDCAEIACDEGMTCIDGACVDERCSPETPERCTTSCSADPDCVPSGPSCLVGRCVGAVCFDVADDTECAADNAICNPSVGCVGGVALDAGIDAGVDAGVDAGPPPSLTGVRRVAVGARHSCAELTGGEIRCWGANDRGQLGDGSTTPTLIPGAATGRNGSGLTLGRDHGCVESAGVFCWGNNARGQLGRSAPSFSATPLAVTAPEDIEGPLALGSAHTCAYQLSLCISPGPCENENYCWGANESGQLGDGTRSGRADPAGMGVTWQVESAAAGDGHTCAITREPAMELWCWGANGEGQLGSGDRSPRLRPNRVDALTGSTEVVAGNRHTCARLDSDVLCWGDNVRGQVGGADARVETPAIVAGLPSVARRLCAGDAHTCALLDDARVYCWGAGTDGQLGDGRSADSSSPVEVLGVTEVVHIACGGSQTCVALDDGTAACWGANTDGQLGDGTTLSRSRPVAVLAPAP